MNDLQISILSDPRFQQLVGERSRFSWMLTAIVLLAYFSFTLAVAFAPQWLAAPIAAGSTISRGMPAGLALIVISFVLTGWYAHRANTRYDRLMREILAGAESAARQKDRV